MIFALFRAEDGAQTRDPQLGRLMLYRLSYFRNFNVPIFKCANVPIFQCANLPTLEIDGINIGTLSY